jgi:putative ABC transport system substrate-binding protein
VQAAQVLGLETEVIPLETIDDLSPLVEKLSTGDADVIFQLPSASIRNAIPDMLGPAALRAGMPIVSDQLLNAPGVLASHSLSNEDMGRQGARLVDKVLHGASPGDIPIELLEVMILKINLDTAQQLGITIPDDVLALATEFFP